MWTDLMQKRVRKQADANEERLECLAEDYAALSRQISYVDNAKSKNDIRRQLISIQEEISQVELAQQQLYSRLGVLSPERVRALTQEDRPPSRLTNASKQKVRRDLTPAQERPVPTRHRKEVHSSILASLSTRNWEYVLAICATVALILWWTGLGQRGHSVVDSAPGIVMAEDAARTVAIYGCGGGFITAFFLSAFSIFQSYLRQRSIKINLLKLSSYCALGILLGGLSCYLAEVLLVDCQLDQYQCGEGAIRGSVICILLSLIALWLPLVMPSLRDH